MNGVDANNSFVIIVMGTGIELITRLKDELGQCPVTLNVVFGFLLAGVQKMLEVDFACPCNPTWNAISLDRLNCAVAFRPDFPSASGLVV
ncbi:hypothetical protein INR49_010955 [Caranx melampygus]|nr:hypothetical protein INR49_010955 [Caranx melampygus]